MSIDEIIGCLEYVESELLNTYGVITTSYERMVTRWADEKEKGIAIQSKEAAKDDCEYFTLRAPERDCVPPHGFSLANHRFAFELHLN